MMIASNVREWPAKPLIQWNSAVSAESMWDLLARGWGGRWRHLWTSGLRHGRRRVRQAVERQPAASLLNVDVHDRVYFPERHAIEAHALRVHLVEHYPPTHAHAHL